SINTSMEMDIDDITTVVNKIFSLHGFKGMTDWFYNQKINVKRLPLFDSTDMINKVIIITYQDKSQVWDTWGRQCRGVILYYNESSGRDSSDGINESNRWI